MAAGQDRQVLPQNVKPLHYDLTIEPDLESFTFSGTVVINLAVLEDSNSITLNTKELDVHDTKVEIDGASLSTKLEVVFSAENETTTVQLDATTLKAGQTTTLRQSFSGKLNGSMAGFYRASWKSQDGTEHWLATTQFSPVDARRAFPCFDEPALKASFSVTLIADPALTCLGNMDVASETVTESGGRTRKAVAFHKTPVMSTHIVAFMVGEFNSYQCNKFRVPVTLYCSPDQDVQHGVYAAELAARTLAFYEDEFGIPYPLPKMDLVAVPDFPMRGMENWGLTTYGTASLLLDEKKSSAAYKQAVTENVQHELAHQWFGNLVTMDFWDGLWLNEGFARWMAWYACDHFYPEWHVWDGYITTNLRKALGSDSLRSSHPVEVPVERADQINQIFDDIAYEKGSAVIRMISKYLGEDVFMDGVRAYLKRHAYGSTTTNDLWRALSEASGKDVEEAAGVWTKIVGYPVVTVTEDEEQGRIHVRQNRFLATGDVKPEEDTILYPMALRLHDKSGVETLFNFNTREATFPIADSSFFKFNADHSGFYRTLYSSDRLEKLGQNAKDDLLPVADRAGLISDAGALAEAGYQKTSTFLNLLSLFDSETECEVWYEIIMRLRSIRAACVFEDEELIAGLGAFQRSLVGPQAQQLGWAFNVEDDHIQQRFKAIMFGAACSAGDEAAKSAAFDMFTKFKDGDRDALHPNLRPAVLRTVLRYGGEPEYDSIIETYQTSTAPDEREDILESLGATRNPELLQRTLGLLLSGEVRPHEIYSVMQGFGDHKDGALALWSWTCEYWEVLYEIGHAVVGFGELVFKVVAPFTRDDQLRMVQDFFKEKNTKVFDMNLAQALDVIRGKQGWMARDKADIEEWLSSRGYIRGSL